VIKDAGGLCSVAGVLKIGDNAVDAAEYDGRVAGMLVLIIEDPVVPRGFATAYLLESRTTVLDLELELMVPELLGEK
jgi:hypothetical protein